MVTMRIVEGATAVPALSGRYELGPVLGRGGMADVYRARDLVLGRTVAVKVLRQITTDPAAPERFKTEARTLAGLSHPGLVTVLDVGVDGDRPYLVMELIEGPTLARACRPAGLDLGRVAGIGVELADALGAVHGRGVVHRDVKPANVLLSVDGRVLLTDFGVAKLTEDAAALTAAGATVGTAAYLAPEQLGGGPVGPAADVYALGLLLIESLTGQQSYQGAPLIAAAARLHRPPDIPVGLPDPLPDLLRRMTDLDPGGRPGTAEVADRLRRLAEAPTGALPTAPSAPAPASASALAPAPAPAPALALSPSPAPAPAPGSLSGVTAPVPVDGTQVLPVPLPDPAGTRARRWRGRVLAGVLLLAAVAAGLVLLLAVRGGGTGGDPVPPNLPARIGQDLQNLHEAVNG
jgi:serine/threonine protein kinase